LMWAKVALVLKAPGATVDWLTRGVTRAARH
jgi:hypothetical protein